MYAKKKIVTVLALMLSTSGVVFAQTKNASAKASKPSMSDILKASQASDWRPLNPENTLYLDMEKGRVVIELAPEFAPKNVANIKALVKEGYFDGLAMIRSHDNYVAQWGGS